MTSISLLGGYSPILDPSYQQVRGIFQKELKESGLGSLLEELSKKTLDNLSRAFLDPKVDKKIWVRILRGASEFKLLQLLCSEILDRIENLSLLVDIAVLHNLERIFSSNERMANVFLCLATTYRRVYYSDYEFRELLGGFLHFMDVLQTVHPPFSKEKIPCYDQGGKDWLIRFLSTLDPSRPIQEQVDLWDRLARTPGSFTEESLSTNSQDPLDFSSFCTKTLSILAKNKSQLSAKEFLDLQNLLESTECNEVFHGSDCLHILRIILGLPTETAPEGMLGGRADLIYWYKAVKEHLGDAVFVLVSNPLSYRSGGSTLQGAIRLMQQLIDMGNPEEINAFLLPFYNGQIPLPHLLDKLEVIKINNDAKNFPEKPLEEVLQAFSSTEQGSLVSVPLSKEELSQITSEYQEIIRLGKELRSCSFNLLCDRAKQIRSANSITKTCSPQDKLLLIAIAREAIRVKFRIYPYNTQVLALLGMLNHPAHLKGRLAQVRTGEGKSTIVAVLAFYQASLGKVVDIISSSRYLAERDQKKYNKFFQAFGITTSHICVENPEQQHFRGQIIFGTNHDFEFAIMRDYFREKQLRTISIEGKIVPRPFEAVIVDEVDNLFIDNALSSARIAVTKKNSFDWVYHPILSFVRSNQASIEMALASEKLIQRIETKKLVDNLAHALAVFHGKDPRDLPSSKSLATWLYSAYKALYIEKLNDTYVINPVEDQSTSKKSAHQIVIVDKKNTGRFQNGCRWQGGLHEFLEAKHDLPIHEEASTSASLSHPVFFGHYSNIYGLTGTMGSAAERAEIYQVYQLDSFDTPPHKPIKRKRLESKVTDTQNNHFGMILSDIQTMHDTERPTLVLFEAIQDTENFALYLKQQYLPFQVLNARQAEHEDFIIARAGAPGAITIATNTAGRGTDIILYPSSLENGGLHVIFAFYPENERVEQQGFGRAARQGQPGSCRLILDTSQSPTEMPLMRAEYLAHLESCRTERTTKLSLSRMEAAGIEKINHRYMQLFISQLHIWKERINPVFLAKVSERLKNEPRQAKPPTEKGLSGEDLELHTTFQTQLQTNREDRWEPLLQNIRDTLESLIVERWAESFYDHLGEFYQSIKEENPRLPYYALREAYLQEIERRYQFLKAGWEKYLVPPEDGFRLYLQHLAQ